MNVISEATKVSSATISGWKGAWKNAQNGDEKKDVFTSIMIGDLGYGNICKILLSFGLVFVSDWVNSMKFEELGNYKNDLIYLFDISDPNPNSYYYLKNIDNFVKLYNVYANGYLNQDYFKDAATKDVFNELVNNPRMYQFNDDDFKTIFGTFDNLVTAWKDNQNLKGDLKFVFLENDSGKVTGDINQIPIINEHIKIVNNKNLSVDKNAKQGMSYKRERSDIESIINNLDNFSKDDIEYLINTLRDRLPA